MLPEIIAGATCALRIDDDDDRPDDCVLDSSRRSSSRSIRRCGANPTTAGQLLLVGGSKMSYQLPDNVVDALLDRLSNDDAFRDRFVADARLALAEVGFAPAADLTIKGGLWDCLFGVRQTQLASKDAIRKSWLQIRKQLTCEQAALMPIWLGAIPAVKKVA
jgi:putative modified peptide